MFSSFRPAGLPGIWSNSNKELTPLFSNWMRNGSNTFLRPDQITVFISVYASYGYTLPISARYLPIINSRRFCISMFRGEEAPLKLPPLLKQDNSPKIRTKTMVKHEASPPPTSEQKTQVVKPRAATRGDRAQWARMPNGKNGSNAEWENWRWGGSNPRPKSLTEYALHAQSFYKICLSFQNDGIQTD